MVKRKLPQKVIKQVQSYVNDLKLAELKVEQVIVYGSYAKGNQNKWSDIDVCIISPDFKDHVNALMYLWRKVDREKCLDIEPIGLTKKDLSNKFSALIKEINDFGIRIL